MSIFAYVYNYIGDEIQGKEMSITEFLSLLANPGIYYKYDHNGEWSVLEVKDYGSFITLHRSGVPNEIKLHHLLTN